MSQIKHSQNKMTLGIILPVNNEHNGPAAWLQKSDHPVVRLGAQLMDFQLRHHLAFPVNLQSIWIVKILHE